MASQEIPYQTPGWVELIGKGWRCRLRPTERDVAQWCAPVVGQLAREVENWRPRLDELGSPGGLVLAPGARLPSVERWASDWTERLGVPLALPPERAGCDTLLLWLQATRQGKIAPGLWRQATAPQLAAPLAPPAEESLPEEVARTKRSGYFEDISDLNLTGFGSGPEG
jgi:hypothetical protein